MVPYRTFSSTFSGGSRRDPLSSRTGLVDSLSWGSVPEQTTDFSPVSHPPLPD